MNKQLTRSLEARYYTDPAIFATEQEQVFARTWQYAGHSSQLKEPGDYFSFKIAGESLFCVRDEDDQIRAFYNVCQHRAHQLVSGAGNAGAIVCPYHAWTYELSGELRGAPHTQDIKGFKDVKICLQEARVELFLGFIFVNLDPGAKGMDEWFPNVRAELSSYVPHWQQLEPLEWVEIRERCNWKVAIENYSECYHCTLNHPTFSDGIVLPESYHIRPQGYCLRHTAECNRLEQMSYDLELSQDNSKNYSSWFLWPLFSFQVYPGNILNTYHWRVLGVDSLVLWRGWYSIGGAENEMLRKLAVQDRATTVEEDIGLIESVQRGLRSRAYKPGPLVVDDSCQVHSEYSVMTLQKWAREAVDVAS